MGNLFSRLLAGILVALFVTCAHSTEETAPITMPGWNVSGSMLPCAETQSQACSAMGGTLVPGTVNGEPTMWCRWGSNGTLAQVTSCTVTKCPDSTWTLSAGKCIRPSCTSEQERINGVCVAKCAMGEYRDANGICKKDCTGRMGEKPLNTHYTTDETGLGFLNGCQIQCKKVVMAALDVFPGGVQQATAKSTNCAYNGKNEGTGLTVSDGTGTDHLKEKPTDKNDCLLNGAGYVQGSTGSITCVNASHAPPENRPNSVKEIETAETENKNAAGAVTGGTTSKSETTTKADGTKTGTTVEIQKNANGTSVKTVTSTKQGQNGEIIKETTVFNVDANGNETEAGSSTDKAPVDDFCRRNPTAQICKGKDAGKFSGSCDAGFTCDGDAATCAIAKASHEMKCQGEKRTELNDLGDSVTGGTDGKGVDTIQNQISDLSTGINANGGGGASCPPLPQIMGKTIEIDSACSILQGLGNAGVALSLLMAGFIVVGGIRGL